MKHKRQTLSKEDGDEKDGGSLDGADKPKSDKILALDEDEKKSCHNCDISGVGDVGSTLSGDMSELSVGRGARGNNNNNTPSATNNNTGFNTNSNGASSVGSTNSVSSCFEKMMADEDSRSQDGSEVVTSPSLGAKKLASEIRVKIEADTRKSPNSSKQQLAASKKSPGVTTKDICPVNSNGVMLAMPDSTVTTPTLPGQGSSARSLTPSSTPGTPASVHLQQGSPLGMQSAHSYMQRPRSSPSSARTLPTNPQNHYQQQSVYANAGMDYRNGIPTNRHPLPGIAQQTATQNAYCPRDGYQQRISYENEMHPMYSRQNQSRVPHQQTRPTNAITRPVYNSSMQFQQQTQYGNVSDYNGYAQTGGYNSSYHRNVQTNAYHTDQAYANPQSDQGQESYMATGAYGYNANGTYHENVVPSHGHSVVSSQSGQHYYGEMQQQQHHVADSYVTHQTSDYRTGSKCHSNSYYEQSNQMHIHQGGDASNIPSSYVSSPDPFPAPGITTTATAIAAATAAVMTPPNSTGHNENSESYGNFGNFYNDSVHVNTAPSADNSNSSSDFNFLTNLANDFAPEYYQLS